MHEVISVRFAFIVERFRFNRVINASGSGDLSREIRYGVGLHRLFILIVAHVVFQQIVSGDYLKHHQEALGKKSRLWSHVYIS
jgi:hypothetical protein